jgi:hypothetical protein
MFVYALDARPRSFRLVMAGDLSDLAIWEARMWTGIACEHRIIEQLRTWESIYNPPSSTIVCCQQDPIPSTLLKALELNNFNVEWVDEVALQEVQKTLRRHRPDPRWLRASWMTFLLSAQRQKGLSEESSYRAALDGLYKFLRKELLGLEATLWAEGLLRCPDHLGPSCPDCRGFLLDNPEIPF